MLSNSLIGIIPSGALLTSPRHNAASPWPCLGGSCRGARPPPAKGTAKTWPRVSPPAPSFSLPVCLNCVVCGQPPQTLALHPPLTLHPASSWMFCSPLPEFTDPADPEPKLTVLPSQTRASGCGVLLGFLCLLRCPLLVAQRVLPHSCGLQGPPLQFC